MDGSRSPSPCLGKRSAAVPGRDGRQPRREGAPLLLGPGAGCGQCPEQGRGLTAACVSPQGGAGHEARPDRSPSAGEWRPRAAGPRSGSGAGSGPGPGAALGASPRPPRPRGGRADPRVLELRGPRGVLVVRHGPARLRAGYLAAIKSPIGLHKSPLSARTNRAI